MHDILVEQARRKAAKKRGGDRKRVDADEFVALNWRSWPESIQNTSRA